MPKNQFARGVSVLVGGTAGAQLLMVLAAPLLTRLFTPEDFGLLAVYGGFLAIFTVIASLRYELAIPLPEDPQEAANVAVLSLLVVTVISLLSAFIVFFAGEPLAQLLGVPILARYFWLLPVGVFFVGFYQVFNYWAIRNKNFKAIANTRIKQAITTLVVQLIGYKLGAGVLLLGQTAGQGMGGFSLSKSAFKGAHFRAVRPAGVIAAAKRYRHFPIFSTWGGLFNTAGTQLPPLMFAALFSPVAAGLYALAHRVLAMPMSVIGSAIGNVFLANAAEAHREKRLAFLVAQVHERLSHIAIPPVLVLIIAGPEIFALIFGSQWREAGSFAQWMAPWLYVVFITSPLSTLFEVMEKQKYGLLFQIVLLVMRTGTIVVGGLLLSLELTIALFSIVSTLCWICFLYWINSAVGNNLATLLKPTGLALIWGCVCTFPLAIGLMIFPKNLTWVVFLAISGSLICGRYFFLLRKVFK